MKKHHKIPIIIIVFFILLMFVPNEEEQSERSNKNTAETIAKNGVKLMTKNNHPRYGDSLKKAKKVWDDTESERVVFPDSFFGYSDNTIITIGDDNGTIDNIELYFENTENPKDIKLEDAINIVKEYLPKSIYNNPCESYKIIPTKDSSDTSSYYVFRSTQEKEKKLFVAYIEVGKDGNANMARLTHRLPRWMISLSTNGMKEKNWKAPYKN